MKACIFVTIPAEGGSHRYSGATLPGSAMLRTGKPVFVPGSGDGDYTALPSIGLRVCRLGKSVSPRFAPRYIDGVAPAILLMPQSALLTACSSGWLPAEEICFDGAFVLGDCMAPDRDLQMQMRFTVEEQTGSAHKEIPVNADDAALLIERASRLNTLKNGDFIIIASSDTLEARRNLRIRAYGPGEEKLLDIKLK